MLTSRFVCLIFALSTMVFALSTMVAVMKGPTVPLDGCCAELQRQSKNGEGEHTGCTMQFDSYHPSKLEVDWVANVGEYQKSTNGVCGVWAATNANSTQRWLEGVQKFLADPDLLWDANAPEQGIDPDVFSHFIYTQRCSFPDGTRSVREVTSWIEPLAGLTRHPLFCDDPTGKPNAAYLLNLEYLVPASRPPGPTARTASGRQSSVFYIDAGMGLYGSFDGGVSQSWFVSTYEQRKLRPDRIIGWEAVNFDVHEVYQQVPADVIPRYSLFPIPCSPNATHKMSPLRVIRDIAVPHDFVVFKLDIDSIDVEMAIMRDISDDKDLHLLVDELYFEHHVNVEPMNGWWRTGHETSSLNDTYALLSPLRYHGIRAHSWV